MRNKISLCVIAGNVEQHIGRFLDHFQGVADEVIVVRAIGNQQPDKTLEIAESRGCKTGEYWNNTVARGLSDNELKRASNAAKWPHVDDFAAARNTACDIATGDWLMWADTDDIITPESVAQIRRLVDDLEGSDIDGVLMRYVIPEDGVINWRERLWRNGKARWTHPIHECLEFDPESKQIKFDGAEIVHASDKRSASRDERNLRILESISEDKRTISQRFHVFQSLIALDRNDEAIPKAIEFIGLEGVGKNERYEAFFQLARLAENSEMKKSMLLQALAVDPIRREAYGELALANIPDAPESSLGWTDAMMALSVPQDAPWNLRRAYYGQLGIGLRGMALRANDRREEADALEANHFVKNGAKISLIHATRGRPAMAWRTRMEWLRSAANPDAIEHIFAIDATDPSSFLLANTRSVIVRGNGGPVDAWNVAASKSSGQILVQLSDDWLPFQGWDAAIIDVIGDTSKPAVLAVSDGHRKDDLLCMAILTRARLNQQKHLFHPEFFSMFSDNWFSRQAFADGVVIDARDRITFEHIHPAFGKAEMDDTYARSNAPFYYRSGEGIMRRLNEGIKVSTDVDGWCDYRDFYSYVAQAIPEGAEIVEIGSWQGQSIVHLCQRLQDLGKAATVNCVDTWMGEQNQPSHLQVVDEHGGSILGKFTENIEAAKVAGMIKVTVGDSAESASQFKDGSMDFIFIDAAHDYDSVVKDLAAWWPKLKEGGIFAGHDYPWHEVEKAVNEHASANGYEVTPVGRCWIKKP
jgi:glycosyltransferase involved in cell wall biosynthesis